MILITSNSSSQSVFLFLLTFICLDFISEIVNPNDDKSFNDIESVKYSDIISNASKLSSLPGSIQ